MSDAQAIVQVGADISDLDKGLGKGEKAVSHFGDTVGKIAKSGSSALGGFVGGLGGMLTSALNPLGALSTGVGLLTDVVKDGAAGNKEWASAMAQAEAVVKSTGGAAGLSAQQLGDLATSLSGGAGVSLAADDAILAGENLLATFTNIGKDTFPQATQTMVDMAQAMGTDVSSQAVALGKALNDPIAGVGALSRVGVTFTDQQKEQIKTMMEAGNVAGAQAVIMGELGKEFGGSAAAAAQADGGMFQLSEQMDNLKGTIADAVMPVFQGFVGFLTSPEVSGALQSVATLIGQGLGLAMDGLKTVLDAVVPPLQAFGAVLLQAFSGELKLDTLQALPGWLQPLGAIFGTIAENVGEFVRAIQGGQDPLAAVGELIKNNFLDLLPKFGELLGGVAGAVADALPGIIAQLGEWAGAFLAWIGPLIPPFLAQLAEWGGAALGWLGAQLPVWLGKLAELGAALWQWISPMIGPALQQLAEWGGKLLGWLGDQLPVWIGKLAEWGGALIAWVGPMIPPLLGKLGELLGTIGAWLLNPALPTLIAKLAEWGGAFLGWIGRDALPFIGEKLAAFGQAIWAWITGGGLTSLITNLQQWGQALIEWIGKDALPFIGEKLAAFGEAIWTWITTDALPTLITNMMALGQALTNWVSKDALPFIGGKLGEFADAIWKWVTETAATIIIKAASIGQGLIDGLTTSIRNGAQAVLQAMGGVVTGAIDWAKQLLGIQSPSEETASIGTYLIEGLTGSLTAGTEAVAGALAPIVELFHAQATLQQEGSMAYWWAGAKGLLPLMERKVDQGSDSLKAYMGPAWAGVFAYIGAEWDMQIPGLKGEWTDFIHDLVALAQDGANAIAAIMAGIPTLPGGGTGPGGGGSSGPGIGGTPNGGGGGGGGGGVQANAAYGGAMTAPVPHFDITLIAQFPDGTQRELETTVAAVRYHTAASTLGVRP